MLIDCTTCVARDLACGDCVITVLLASPPPATRPAPFGDDVDSDVDTDADTVELDDADRVALGNLASAGLVPPLRLVAALPTGTCGDESGRADPRMSGNDREIA